MNPIGVVNAPAIAEGLSACGFSPITGEDFRSAAIAVRTYMRDNPSIPIIVGDDSTTHPSGSQWVDMIGKVATVVVVRLPGATGFTSSGIAESLDAPVSLLDIARACGVSIQSSAASIIIGGEASNPFIDDPFGEDWEEVDDEPVATPSAQTTTDPWAQQDSGAVPPAPQEPAQIAFTPQREQEDDPWSTTGPHAAIGAETAPSMTTAVAPVDAVPMASTPVAPTPRPVIPAPTTAASGGANQGVMDVFDQQVAGIEAGARRAQGHLLITWAGKGGVGKSTVSMALAQYAASHGGTRQDPYRVVLIDGNRGQGDLRRFLRLSAAAIPTIFDASGGNPSQALVSSSTINAERGKDWGSIDFALVAAPARQYADPAITTNETYRQVINYCRSVADLVIVDTQISEAHDNSRLFDDVFLPMAASPSSGAWLFGLSDPEPAGISNLVDQSALFREAGVPRDRMLLAINRIQDHEHDLASALQNSLSVCGNFMGLALEDASVRDATTTGRLAATSPALAPVLATTLHWATGNQAFRISPDSASAAPSKPGFFARLLGRR